MRPTSTHPLSPATKERLARKRVGMRLGWLVHAFIFISVNLLLAGISHASGRHWS